MAPSSSERVVEGETGGGPRTSLAAAPAHTRTFAGAHVSNIGDELPVVTLETGRWICWKIEFQNKLHLADCTHKD